MGEPIFDRVDAYLDSLFVPADPLLDAALAAATAAGMPAIQVSPSQGKLLYLLAKLAGARRILEIGCLAGYSAIWLGRALPPGGRLISLELLAAHAEVARGNLTRAGLADVAEVWVGPAADSLAKLAAEGAEPFDLIFIDADKAGYPHYLERALELTRSGSLIVADNVVRAGRVLRPETLDDQGARTFNASLAAEPRLEALVLQVVGVKGHDGLAIARVR